MEIIKRDSADPWEAPKDGNLLKHPVPTTYFGMSRKK